MSFRTVVVKERCKLDLKMNYMVCRKIEETRVFIPEISVLILESTAISLTTALLSELIKNNVKIIFCDEKHNPESELLPYYGSYNNSKKIKSQINWSAETKAKVWARIVKQKIKTERDLLYENGFFEDADLLNSYMVEVQYNDITNREGHAAKVYFNRMFGMDFNRRETSNINAALNYGYAILLSCFNREIVKSGYLTQLGVWHRNEFNDFNLASDLMEPFRVIIDRVVYALEEEDYKSQLLDIFNMQLLIDGKKQYLENAIAIYCQSVFSALENNNEGLIKFYE